MKMLIHLAAESLASRWTIVDVILVLEHIALQFMKGVEC